MFKRLATLALVATATATLAGCVSANIPDTYTPAPIVVPSSLAPTNVPEPMQTLDEACSVSWVVVERAMKTLNEHVAALEKNTGLKPDPTTGYVDPAESGAITYYASLADASRAFADEVTAAASLINHSQIEQVLTTIGEREATTADNYALYTSPRTTADDIADYEMHRLDNFFLLVDYATLCGESISETSSS